MNERAEELGGRVTVTANHPQGTVVSAVLPIDSMEDVQHG